MRQLQLFTTADLAVMRDRSASRRYSPEREEFRREHARRRSWGLLQRHAAKLARLHAERQVGQLPGGVPPSPAGQEITAEQRATPPVTVEVTGTGRISSKEYRKQILARIRRRMSVFQKREIRQTCPPEVTLLAVVISLPQCHLFGRDPPPFEGSKPRAVQHTSVGM